jgi:hypothetical protein
MNSFASIKTNYIQGNLFDETIIYYNPFAVSRLVDFK